MDYMKNVSAVRMFSDPCLHCKQTWGGTSPQKESHLGWEPCLRKRRQVFETSRFSYFSGLEASLRMEPRMKVKTQESKQSNEIPFDCLGSSHAGAHSVVRRQTKRPLKSMINCHCGSCTLGSTLESHQSIHLRGL